MTEFIQAVGSATPTVAATGAGLAALKTIVGPTARVFGSTMSEFVEYRMRNWLGIARAAELALGDDPSEGQVHPRVVHQVLEEGTYLDDPVMQSYVGGLLAAARTPGGADDRAAYYINLLAALPANQVRLHHAIYSALADYDRSADCEIGDLTQDNLTIKAPIEAAVKILTIPPTEDAVSIVSNTATGLVREGLLYHGAYAIGSVEMFTRAGLSVTEPYMYVRPTPIGALLFLWGRGIATSDAELLGRTPLRPLDPPGPVFREVTVGGWT